MKVPNLELVSFIETQILPRYASFDAAHNLSHVVGVIRRSLDLVRTTGADINMVYAIAAYHDTGLVVDRKTHHLESGRIIREDARLLEWFTPEEIEVMAQAAEDHRASSDHEPRSIYGKIVAEADRLIDTDTILRRTVQYGFAHYPEMSREEQIARAIAHLHEKYAEGGYLKLWIPESPNAGRLRELWALIRREDELLLRVENIYDEIKKWYEKSGLPLKRFFNTSGMLYKEMKLKDKLPDMSEDEQLQLLATNGMLVKRPLVVAEGFVLTGFKEKEWTEKIL